MGQMSFCSYFNNNVYISGREKKTPSVLPDLKRKARAQGVVAGSRLTDQLDLWGCCYRAEVEKGKQRD